MSQPMCPPLERPAFVDRSEDFVALATIDAAHAESLAREAITSSFTRPADIGKADIEPARLVWAPFWRIEGSVDGFHLGIGAIGVNGKTFPMPTGGARHRDGVAMITARRLFPYGPAMPVSPFAGTPVFGTAPALDVGLTELTPREGATINAGEWIDADVPRDEAMREASRHLLRAVMPTSALFASYEPQIRSVAFVHYPLWITRYAYAGEVRTSGAEVFFVAHSARSGRVVRAHHPSAFASVANKVRRLFAR